MPPRLPSPSAPGVWTSREPELETHKGPVGASFFIMSLLEQSFEGEVALTRPAPCWPALSAAAAPAPNDASELFESRLGPRG